MNINISNLIALLRLNLAIIDTNNTFGIHLRNGETFFFYAKPWWLMGKSIFLRGDVNAFMLKVDHKPTVKELRWLFDDSYQITFEESWAMHHKEAI